MRTCEQLKQYPRNKEMNLLSINPTKRSNILKQFNEPFKHQLYKMVKHTQTIRRLSVFNHFVGLKLKGRTRKRTVADKK